VPHAIRDRELAIMSAGRTELSLGKLNFEKQEIQSSTIPSHRASFCRCGLQIPAYSGNISSSFIYSLSNSRNIISFSKTLEQPTQIITGSF